MRHVPVAAGLQPAWTGISMRAETSGVAAGRSKKSTMLSLWAAGMVRPHCAWSWIICDRVPEGPEDKGFALKSASAGACWAWLSLDRGNP